MEVDVCNPFLTQGYGAVAPAQGLGALSQLLSQRVTSTAAVTVNPFDWPLFLTGERSLFG